MKAATGVEVRSATGRQLVKYLIALEESGTITPTHLALVDGELAFKTYEALGAYIGKLRDATAWWLGDWLLFGEGAYGDRYAQAVESTGRAKSTLEDYARVALYIPPKRRKRQLTFHHHRLVAKRSITPDDQDRWLAEAVERGWSVEEMHGAMNAVILTDPGSNGRIDVEFTATDTKRLLKIVRRLVREASDLGDGRVAVNVELVHQLRAMLGS